MRQYRQFTKLLAPVVLIVALAAQYGFGKLPVARPQLLPVREFPRAFGQWRGVGDISVDPEIQAKLPTATIFERVYQSRGAGSVDLTLVSANDNIDIHDPAVCLPDQGWKVLYRGAGFVNGQAFSAMRLTQDGQRMTVYYWLAGYYAPRPPHSEAIREIAQIRNRVIGKREGESVLVRLMAPTEPDGDAVLSDFVRESAPALRKMIGKG